MALNLIVLVYLFIFFNAHQHESWADAICPPFFFSFGRIQMWTRTSCASNIVGHCRYAVGFANWKTKVFSSDSWQFITQSHRPLQIPFAFLFGFARANWICLSRAYVRVTFVYDQIQVITNYARMLINYRKSKNHLPGAAMKIVHNIRCTELIWNH